MGLTWRNVVLVILFLGISFCEEQGLVEVNGRSLEEANHDNACLKQLRAILSPEYLNELWKMVSMSGKGVNQLGDFQGCDTENFQHIVLNAKLVNEGFVVARIGLCSPRECNSNYHFQKINKMVKDIASASLPPEMELEAFIENPREVNAEPKIAGFYVMMIVTCIIFLLWILGAIVGLTKLGNTQSVQFGMEQSDSIQNTKKKWALALYSFNPIENFRKLVTVKEEGDKTLDVLHGVRVLSICWVIVGHGFAFAQFGPVLNMETVSLMFSEAAFAVVPGGEFAVDSFFYLSGFLTFYLLISKMYPRSGNIGFKNTLLIYFHRYYRLIFPLLYIQFFTMWVMRYTANGPISRRNTDMLVENQCRRYWWSNLIFINNIVPSKGQDICIGWVWYLANDMQFFWLSPLVIFLYCKNRKIGIWTCVSLILSSMFSSLVLTVYGDVDIRLHSDKIDAGQLMYGKPWTRMGAYFVGALFGISYFELKNREKYYGFAETKFNQMYDKLKQSRLMSTMTAFVGVSLTFIYVILLQIYYRDCSGDNVESPCWPRTVSIVYNTTSRPFFVLGLGLVLAPTFVGRLRAIRAILSAELFVVLARLNYIVYMIHSLVLFWYINDARHGTYINNLNQWFFSICTTAISFLFAIPVTLICEVPFINLEKYVLFPQKKALPNVQNHQENNNLLEDTKKAKYYPINENQESMGTEMGNTQ